MRSSKSRSRNKSNRQRTLVNVVNRVFDSSGPEGKVRGTPQQIIEKYLALARDAQLSNDRVAEQSFLQHAEHYTRMLGEAQREMAERQQFQQSRSEGDDGRDGQGNGQNSHYTREGGNRDQAPRDQGNRDQGSRDPIGRDQPARDSARDDNRRDQGHRDQPRDGAERGERQGGRDHGARDQGGRDHGGRGQPHAESAGPRIEVQDAVEASAVPQVQPEGLPNAVILSEDEPAGLVDTPETAAKPSRSRAPRAPRGDKPATAPRSPRGRRKTSEDQPVDEAKAESSPEDTPAIGEE